MGAALDTGNQGVSALGASLVQNVLDVCPGAEISMFVGNRSSADQAVSVNGQSVPVGIVNYRMSPRARLDQHLFCLFAAALLYRIPSNGLRTRIRRLFPLLNRIAGSGFVGDIQGGDSFSDIYGLPRFLLGTLPRLIVLWLGKEFHLLPQTYGPYKSPIARCVARYVIRSAATVIARDPESARLAKELAGGKSATVRTCPDVAFTMRAASSAPTTIDPPLPEPRGTTIGVNISGLLFNGGYSRDNMFGLAFDYKAFAHRLVQAVLDGTEAHVLLIPHNYGPPGGVNNDSEACEAVFDALVENSEGRLHLLRGEYDQHQVKATIGTCDFFTGARMHACIAGLSQGVPTVGVAYSKKFEGVFDTVGMKEWAVDARSTSQSGLVEKTMEAYRNRARIAAVLGRKSEQVRAEVQDTFRNLLQNRNSTHQASDNSACSEQSNRE